MSTRDGQRALFIMNGVTKNNGTISVSGGDIRFIEIVKNTPVDEKHILTTSNGKEFLNKYPDAHADKVYVIPHETAAGLVSNLQLCLKSLRFGDKNLKMFRRGIVYTSSEHLYDVLPAVRLKLFHACKWVAPYHWVEDYPWREKRGNTPVVSRYAYWLNRYIAGWLIKRFSDQVLAVSEPTKEKLIDIKKINPQKIKTVYCGVNYEEMRAIIARNSSEKGSIYDAVFMKRLNYGKGVLDLLNIWRQVVLVRPTAKLAIIGDGSDDVLRKVTMFITEHGLQENIELLGVIYDLEEKMKVLNASKIFLLPTHEENWAIVIGEAMTAELPVVVSSLKELKPIWGDAVVWCERGNTKEFADAVIALLSSRKKREKYIQRGLQLIPKYDWEEIGRNELADFLDGKRTEVKPTGHFS